MKTSSYLAGLVLSTVVCAGADRGTEMPPLRVSENGRFLVRDDGSAFFPLADTAWEIAWRLNRDEVAAYLEKRASQHFNAIGIVAFFGEAGGHADRRGNQPFAKPGRYYDPLSPLTTPGNNPDVPGEYDYWDNLEYVIDSAAAKGIYVILLPAWGNCVAGGYGNGRPSSEIIFNATTAYRYGRWIGNRFKQKRNLIWMLGGDRSAVYGKRDYRSVFRALARGITAGVAGGEGQVAAGRRSAPLISYHPRKWAPNSSKWFHHDAWLSFNSIQDQPKDQVRAIELDYGLSPAKPTWLFEGGYEHRANLYTDWQVRFQSYQTVFAGGFGVTYGNMNIYAFGEESGSKDEPQARAARAKWENSLDDPGAGQMQHLLKLMMSWTNEQFLNRLPDQALIDGDTGTMEGGEGIRSTRLQATRGRRGDYAMVYSANGRNIRVRMARLSGPSMNAFWFDPRNGLWWRNGRYSPVQTPFLTGVPAGSDVPVREFDPPGGAKDGNDWVLVLKRGE